MQPQRHIPLTPAAASSRTAPFRGDALRLALEIALNMEGERRTVTLGGSLLTIPATVAVMVAVAASLGVTGGWLVACALTGLSAGPGVCLSALAVSNLFGTRLVHRRYRRATRLLGIDEACAEQGWTRAQGLLDAHGRARLTGQTSSSGLLRPDAGPLDVA